ncbi:hypothetical protein PGTUg99_005720 [Puccinia graminis f. sp. tritici]|uniref:Uncharacterized protein n=1 Tax=Puccinia graminis f. sp. tritici TaxID=56615 RepID=A0A5B0MJ45_PUCGR|nr:hypothetical protein PGTUg99_005720 [Puccinia graminis f. sp. tritici]
MTKGAFLEDARMSEWRGSRSAHGPHLPSVAERWRTPIENVAEQFADRREFKENGHRQSDDR